MSRGNKRGQNNKKKNRKKKGQRKTATVKRSPNTGADARSRHLVAINRAQRELRRERQLRQLELNLLLRQVPELKEVIWAVAELVDAADPTKAHTIGASSPSTDPDLEADGITVVGPERDQTATPRYATDTVNNRKAVDWLQRELGRTASKIHRQIGGEPGDEKYPERPPRCQKKLPAGHPARTLPDEEEEKCPMYGRNQPYEATICAGCGVPFGRRK